MISAPGPTGAYGLVVEVVPDVRRLNPNVELCFFGLYAPANAELLTGLGAVAVIGGEFETELAGLVSHRLGDPDFWNGMTHAVRIVREMHRRHPDVTCDATIKVEHLLRDARL